MTHDEFERLKALAEGVEDGSWHRLWHWLDEPYVAYAAAMHPGTALALIAEVERLRALLVAWAGESTAAEHEYYANAHPVHHTSATDFLFAEAHRLKAEAR